MKVHIIGAGISGLSLGCYLQKCGFTSAIFEKHSVSGGLCATWKRGEYNFDGAIHWIMGSNNSNPFYKLWSEIIDMDSIPFFHHEEYLSLEVIHNQDRYGKKTFYLYTNIDKLQQYLMDIAPEDIREINNLIHLLRTIQRYELPPLLDNTPATNSLRKQLGMISYLPMLPTFLKWIRITNYSFAKRLKNPFLKEAIELLFDGEEQNLLILTMPLAYYDKKGAGYPLGGSCRFAQYLEENYKQSGGSIHYDAGVKKVLTKNNQATGIQLENGEEHSADIIISCVDWQHTAHKLLGGKFLNKKLQQLSEGKKLKPFYSNILISLGMNRTFPDTPHIIKFTPEKILQSPDGTSYDRICLHIYNYDQTLAPKGKTVVNVAISTFFADYWINLRANDKSTYNKQKTDIANQVIDILENKFGDYKKYVEVVDVATPATYTRYTNNWRGSTQGWMPGKYLLAPSPVKPTFPGLKNFYYTSHWSIPGGGLPITIKNARNIALKICKEYHAPFMGKIN